MKERAWVGIFAVVTAVLFKLWLTSSLEIIDLPYDSEEYARMILELTARPSNYGPGTAYLGIFFRELGIPLRLGLEMSYLGSAYVLVTGIYAPPVRSALSFLLFVILIFDPQLTQQTSFLMSDSITLLYSYFAVGFFVLAIRLPARRIQYALLGGLFCALSCLTRTVLPIWILTFVVGVPLWFCLDRTKQICWLSSKNLSAIGGVVSIVVGATGAVSYQNYKLHRSFFGISVMDNSIYRNYYLALARVGKADGEPFFAVDASRRALAAQASATFRTLLPCLNQSSYLGVNFGGHDIPSAWLLWPTIVCLGGTGPNEFARLKMIAAEIDRSCQLGTVYCRLRLPIPDPRLRIVFNEIPMAWKRSWRAVFETPAQYQIAQPLYREALFNRAATRRKGLESNDDAFKNTVTRWVCAGYKVFETPWLGLVDMGAFLLLLAFSHQRRILPTQEEIGFVVGFLIATINFVFYLFFDASGWPVGPRYVLLTHGLLAPLFILALAKVRIGSGWQWLRRVIPDRPHWHRTEV